VDEPQAGDGDQDEDDRGTVGPVDPPGPQAHHPARGVAAAGAELKRLLKEDRVPAVLAERIEPVEQGRPAAGTG
jgi:hypothetical protein